MSSSSTVVVEIVRRASRCAPFVILIACGQPEGDGPQVDTGVIAPGAPRARLDTTAPADSLALAELLHAGHARAAAGDAGWEYVRERRVDLDGDGAAERLVVIAQVPLRNGEPVWDDSQSWNVYVASSDGRRTYLLARVVQLGDVEAVVAPAEAGGGRPVGIIVRSPTSLSIYEARYRGPDSVTVRRVGHQEIDPAVSPTPPPSR